jgi:hypothetical protein
MVIGNTSRDYGLDAFYDDTDCAEDSLVRDNTAGSHTGFGLTLGADSTLRPYGANLIENKSAGTPG